MKIKFIQLDPNGLCNAGCWFCPVSTKGNPKRTTANMSPELLEKVFQEITKERDSGLITADFLYFSHYNEILIYKHFEFLLQMMRKYKWVGYFLSNGTPLTKQKADLLAEYKDVYAGMCINSPCYTESRFEARTGMKKHMLPKLIANIRYAIDAGLNPVMVINGIDDRSNIIKGPEFPDMCENELRNELAQAKYLFPEISISDQPHLIDRAGLLDHVITNIREVGEVIGCHGNREYEWLHINALGELFVCCNDFDMDYVFGNLKDNSIKDLWLTPNHLEVINKAYKGMCSTCSSAKLKKI